MVALARKQNFISEETIAKGLPLPTDLFPMTKHSNRRHATWIVTTRTQGFPVGLDDPENWNRTYVTLLVSSCCVLLFPGYCRRRYTATVTVTVAAFSPHVHHYLHALTVTSLPSPCQIQAVPLTDLFLFN